MDGGARQVGAICCWPAVRLGCRPTPRPLTCQAGRLVAAVVLPVDRRQAVVVQAEAQVAGPLGKVGAAVEGQGLQSVQSMQSVQLASRARLWLGRALQRRLHGRWHPTRVAISTKYHL
jgi:hypothetical protein